MATAEFPPVSHSSLAAILQAQILRSQTNDIEIFISSSKCNVLSTVCVEVLTCTCMCVCAVFSRENYMYTSDRIVSVLIVCITME